MLIKAIFYGNFSIIERKKYIMYLVLYVKNLLNMVKRNCEQNMRRVKCFFQSIRNGTYINYYIRKFYVKRYKTYRSLSIYRLKQVLGTKSASLDTSTSSVWSGALLGAALGSIASNIGTISEHLLFNAMIGDMMSNVILIILLLLNLVMPCVSLIIAVFMGLSLVYTLRFYLLFFFAMVAVPIMNQDPYGNWVPFSLIVLLVLNAYSFFVTVIELSKQCRIIECNIIRNILRKHKNI